MYYEMKYDSPVGRLTIASDGSNLAGLWMEGQKYFGGTVTGELHPCGELPVFSRTKDWLDRYFPEKAGAVGAAAGAHRRRIPPDGVGTAL